MAGRPPYPMGRTPSAAASGPCMQLGLEVQLVSGQEEARLIYLGVLSGMAFGETPHIIIDIGAAE